MIVAVGMVKDEQDVIGCTIRHLLAEGVDRVVVADNLSTDATPLILDQLADDTGRVDVVEDREFGYYQARKMTGLAHQVADEGATWVVPFDADEVFYAPEGTLAEFLHGLPSDVGIVEVTGWDHVPSFSDDRLEDCPFRRLTHRRSFPQRLPKVVFRASEQAFVHMGNHDVSNVAGRRVSGLTLRHFQFRSVAQMTAKLRNGREVYEATDIHRMHGSHWREGGLLSDEQLAAKWSDLLGEESVYDPAPCRC